MNLSKKRLSLLNISFTVGYQVVMAIYGLIVPNLILNIYGAELHGYTSTINSIMSYISLLNAGVAPVAIQALYDPLVKKDSRKISEIILAVDKFYIKTGSLYIVIILICAAILPFIISAQISNTTVVLLMIVIGATSTIDCFIYSKYRVLLQADQRLYILSMLDIGVSILRIIVQLILIKLQYNIVIIMGIPTILVILRSTILSRYCKRTYDYIKNDVQSTTDILSKRWSALIHQIAGLIVYNTDIVILTIFKNLIQVSIYSIYNMIFAQISNFFNAFTQGLLASFGRIINENRLKSIYNIYEFGFFNIVAFIYGIAASMILPFIQLYTKGRSNIPYVDIYLASLFIIIGIIQNLRIPFLTIVNAAGKFKETRNQAILEAGINIVISLILLKPLGMYGLLIGTVCSNLYRTIELALYSHKYILQTSPFRTFARFFKTLLILITIILLNYYLFKNVEIDSWWKWSGKVCALSILAISIVGIINLITEPNMLRKIVNTSTKKLDIT